MTREKGKINKTKKGSSPGLQIRGRSRAVGQGEPASLVFGGRPSNRGERALNRRGKENVRTK